MVLKWRLFICVLCACFVAAPVLKVHAVSPNYNIITADAPDGFVKVCADLGGFGALDSDGRVYVFGKGIYIPDLELPPIVDIAMGNFHIAALGQDGKVYAWGLERGSGVDFGQTDFPEDLPPIKAIAAGGYKTMMLTEDGRVLSFGNTNDGWQEYVPDMPEIVAIACSAYTSLALDKDGYLHAWGIDYSPASKKIGPNVTGISAVNYDFVYLDADGKINEVRNPSIYGDMGGLPYRSFPYLSNITRITGSSQNYAAIDFQGRVVVWGYYMNNPDPVVDVPSSLPPIQDIVFTNDSAIALGMDGKIYEWGPDRKGNPVSPVTDVSSKEDFIHRINTAFLAIAQGNYDYACDVFGFSGSRSKESFRYGMSYVDKSSITILSATVDEASIKEEAGVMSAKVTLYVQQDKKADTFGYMAEWPVGVYSMDFIVEMRNSAIYIPEFVEDGGVSAPGLTAIYLPDQTENSLTVFDTDADSGFPFGYDTPAPFMQELWSILQSYDLASRYAIFWGYGSAGETNVIAAGGELDVVQPDDGEYKESTLPLYLLGIILVVLIICFYIYRVKHLGGNSRAKDGDTAANTTGDQKLDEILSGIEDHISNLRRLDKTVQGKLDEPVRDILNTTEQIVEQLRKHPTGIREIRQFLNYTLPTTINLLQNYDEFSRQSLQGRNIRSAMEKIEGMMNTIVDAFHRQLDALFQDQALNIGIEIEIMKNMLSQAGDIADIIYSNGNGEIEPQTHKQG